MDESNALKHASVVDLEQGVKADAQLLNTSVHSIAWRNITVTVNDRQTKEPRNIVENVDGYIEAGQLCALMGPSGSGKTTLLDVLAQRPMRGKTVTGSVLVNGAEVPLAKFREMSCFVEQEDALIGSLTVAETLHFASRLATCPSALSAAARQGRVEDLIEALGLREQAHALVGTPLRRGLSGGQKRRVGVASQLITGPRVLFLDEPTSGLDAHAGREVVAHLRRVARRHRLVVVASVHQPSAAAFALFDRLLLLARGRPCYFGPVAAVAAYCAARGRPVPPLTSAAEFLLDAVASDFAADREAAAAQLAALQGAWARSAAAEALRASIQREVDASAKNGGAPARVGDSDTRRTPGFGRVVLALLHRSFIKSYRDVVAYGVRVAMYFGLALMMGTIWLRLDTDQASIQPVINGLFFGSAFMSFMAVAYVPAFIEDRQQYVKEHRNGLYGATALMLSNFLVGVPYLFLISLLFSLITYFLTNLRPTATAFLTYLLWLFLDLLAAESLVVLVTAAVAPSFVGALAVVAFANGLWMGAGGFLVAPSSLNVFYTYAFHYWDYQTWVFGGMLANELGARVYDCGAGCRCMYDSALADRCQIDGGAVLESLGYDDGRHLGRNVGIMLGIIAGYRLAGWVVLRLRR